MLSLKFARIHTKTLFSRTPKFTAKIPSAWHPCQAMGAEKWVRRSNWRRYHRYGRKEERDEDIGKKRNEMRKKSRLSRFTASH